ncbi:glycosyltransferase family 9 protein [Siphonobacter curvatus]|uniref:Glycosyl transferase n=1 Tax=Siphonobacter curvatus TaxID=2094562 RepID=A0A2S7IQW2_9BACT|nr:glycosyltransferase family 9 protein [Siphonobacter curvatus]PQA60113.1 glycosyl transferase [Siphonobacter curvatus]
MTKTWQNARNLLCIRLDNMGDVLMTTPAFRALKEGLPQVRLTLLTSSVGAAIASFIPEVDEVMTFDVPWMKGASGEASTAVNDLVQQLKARNFDGAILFTVQSQNPLPTALICYLASIPRLLGYCRENPYQLMSDWVPDPEILYATRHEVERQLHLVARIGCITENQRLSVSVSGNVRPRVRAYLDQIGLHRDKPWLVLHAGVSEEKRRYPAEGYLEACQELIQEQAFQVVLTGNASEKNYVATLQQTLGNRAFALAGDLSLEWFIALMAEAPVLVSNNTGPVHIAAALGTPVVVLYAMTNPQHTPWLVENRVLYFEVPEALRSRNVLLQQFPGTAEPKASPQRIVESVRAVMRPVEKAV